MAVHRGGRKRAYKKKGRLSARKCYQQWCRQQLNAGMVPSASGRWDSDRILSTKIAEVYAAQRGA